MDFFRKNKVWLIFGAILALGIFFRSYHFSDWLRFELDQSRDARIIDQAVLGGPQELPLLGPRAQSTYLRLGPAFYYISYISAKILGPTPPNAARGVWMLSILALPVLFFYFRRYFKTYIAFLLLALASFSVFLAMYSRFAWNPNALVFFVPLSFYALLKAVDFSQKRREVWLIVSLAALSISTQLHFLAFIILPAVFLIFLLVKRPRFKLIIWSFAAAAALIFYVPVIINECQTGGDNTKEFIKAVSKNNDKYPGGIIKKIFFNFKEHSGGYLVLISGQDGNSLLSLNLNGVVAKFRACREDCPQDYYISLFSLVFLISGFGLLIYKFKKETQGARKDFLMLNGIFFLACFAVFTPLAFDMSPRFFLLSAFLPYIFLGLLFESAPKRFNFNIILPAIIISILLFSNGKDIKKRFSELSVSNRENVAIGPDLILKENARVTYAQEIEVAEYMVKKQEENGYPILFYGEARYVPALAYILDKKEIIFNDRVSQKQIYRYVNYFWVDYARSDGQYKLGKKEEPAYNIAEIKNFGTLAVLTLNPKEDAITDDYKIFEEKEKRSSKPKRFIWGELLE